MFRIKGLAIPSTMTKDSPIFFYQVGFHFVFLMVPHLHVTFNLKYKMTYLQTERMIYPGRGLDRTKTGSEVPFHKDPFVYIS